MNYEFLKYILHEENTELSKRKIKDITNSISLHVLAGNYNWDNGLDIPRIIIENPYCDLGTALMIFYNADGYRMLEDIDEFCNSSIDDWEKFVIDLYNRIVNKQFQYKEISFVPPLSKVQIFKLKKKSKGVPPIFVQELIGENVEIPVL